LKTGDAGCPFSSRYCCCTGCIGLPRPRSRMLLMAAIFACGGIVLLRISLASSSMPSADNSRASLAMPNTSLGRPLGLPDCPFLKRPVSSLLPGGSFFSLDEEVAVFAGDEIRQQPVQFQKARQCGARTRSGKPCRSPATKKGRCRLHGGASGSGGPPGERNGQYRHGERTKAAIAERQKFSALLKLLRAGLT
jgi:hypothetical protein